MPEEQIKIELSTRLKSSIDSMLMSDVPVGAFVSGGVDSSLIAGMANESNDIELSVSY